MKIRKNNYKEIELEKDIKKDQIDSSNATLGLAMSGMFFIMGFIILFINPQMGILMLMFSVFPLCETFRGIISIRKRKIIRDPLYIQSEELIDQVDNYTKKLKLISKIKIISILASILLIVIIIMTN